MPRPRGRERRVQSEEPRARCSSLCLPFLWCWFGDSVKVALERIDMLGPELPELRQPLIQLLKSFWLQAVETALCVHGGFHETSLAQHPQVLGHGRLRHPQPALDLAHRQLGQDQQAQDRAPVRLGDDGEGRFHGHSILHMAYTCQGILKSQIQVARRGHASHRHTRGPSGRSDAHWASYTPSIRHGCLINPKEGGGATCALTLCSQAERWPRSC